MAGRFSTKKLPNTPLYLPVGLMLIQPNINISHTEKGVTPHKEILPTTQHVLEKKDIQPEWIMEDIKISSSNAGMPFNHYSFKIQK